MTGPLRPVRVLAAVLACLAAWPAPAAGAGGRAAVISPEEYAREVDALLTEMDRIIPALAGDAGGARRRLRDLEERVPRGAVRLDGGQVIPLDNGWLSRGLAEARAAVSGRAAGERLRRLRGELAALARELAALRETAGVDPDRALLDRILAGPEFRDVAPEGWLEAFMRWLEPLARWLGARDGPRVPLVLWTGIGLAALAAVGLFPALSLRRRLVADVRRRVAPEPGQGVPPAAWEERAEGAAGAGDYRAAMRALYLAMLDRLARRGVIERDPARTGRELVQALRDRAGPGGGSSGMVEDFGRLTELFEAARYGPSRPGSEEYRVFRGLWERLAGEVTR